MMKTTSFNVRARAKRTATLLAVALTLLAFAATVHADVIGFKTNRADYMTGVGGSDWEFTGIGPKTGGNSGGQDGNGWTQWDFTVGNNNSGTSSISVVYSDLFNGNGLQENADAGLNGNGTAWLQHNSANQLKISFDDPNVEHFVNSFFLTIQPWSSWSAADAFDVTVKYWDTSNVLQSKTLDFQLDSTNSFLGIWLEDGNFLSSITLNSANNGTPNNGYKIAEMGFGGGNNVPEPATTVLFLALGAFGVGASVRRRRQKLQLAGISE